MEPDAAPSRSLIGEISHKSKIRNPGMARLTEYAARWGRMWCEFWHLLLGGALRASENGFAARRMRFVLRRMDSLNGGCVPPSENAFAERRMRSVLRRMHALSGGCVPLFGEWIP